MKGEKYFILSNIIGGLLVVSGWYLTKIDFLVGGGFFMGVGIGFIFFSDQFESKLKDKRT